MRLAVLLALVAGPVLASEPPPAVAQIADEMLAVTVQLERNCSGTIIQSDRDEASGAVTTLVLTAKHCTARVGEPHDVIVPEYVDGRLVRETVYKATTAGRFASHDLAYLRLLDEDTVLPFARVMGEGGALWEGEEVWAVGYPVGWSRTLTDGRLGPIESIPFPDRNRMTEYRRATPAIVGGSSGGGLYHLTAEGYELIGVTSAGYMSSNHISYWVPSETVAAYVALIGRTEALMASR